VRKARGDVLEASAGTGRNGKYYDERKCRSWTFVDRSKEMLDIARTKFKKEHPAYRAAATFLAQSVLDPLPVLEEDSNPKDERHRPPPGNSDSRIPRRQPRVYTTVVQTMGLCSTPQPAALLARLGDLADANGGRVLLLEHGRSYYGWMNALLDRTAGVHAERHGCWWNRDIGKLIEESGLEVVKVKRWHFGTTWWVELKGRGKGGGREGREGRGGEELGREEGPWGRGGEKESGGK
jgi:methyltransferase OMS1